MPMSFGGISKSVVATKIVAADGSGDYTDIQTAINALPSVGGAVYIREGTYNISTSITITKSNVRLEGSGAATSIVLADGVEESIIKIYKTNGTPNWIVISGLKLIGNKGTHSGTSHGINIDNSSHTLISNIYIINPESSGIYLDVGSYTWIWNNVIYGCGDYGIYKDWFTHDVWIEFNEIDGSEKSGIYCFGKNSIITGNVVHVSAYHGIHLISGAYGNLVTGNRVYVSSVGNSDIYSGICLETDGSNYCVRNVITSNYIRGSYQKYGYEEKASTDDYNIFTNNIIKEWVTAAKNVQGVNDVVANNIEQS